MEAQKVLEKVIKNIKISSAEEKKINHISSNFCKSLRKKIKNKGLSAQVFVGGSLAKKTIVKKDKQDIDVFVRFNSKYRGENLSKLLENVLFKDFKKIHGSRDYFRKEVKDVIIEVVPVLKIRKPNEAENITDLSFFHVKYIKSLINKHKRLSNEIMLAKTFAHASNCYGAESYIKGFSGYALELLICHFKSFKKFIKTIAKHDFLKTKLIIDDKGFFKPKKSVLRKLNESKLESPIILIDPTFKQRNALAGLSNKTLTNFKKHCKKFLKNPNEKLFKPNDESKELIKKHKNQLNIVKIKTSKQKGDISGTKSKKFYEFFTQKISKEFLIKKRFFKYAEEENTAYLYYLLNKKPVETIKGPKTNRKRNTEKFLKKHKNSYIKGKQTYAKISHDLNFSQFFKKFKKTYQKTIKQMSIKTIEII